MYSKRVKYVKYMYTCLVLFANQLPQGDKTWEGENETRHHRLLVSKDPCVN